MIYSIDKTLLLESMSRGEKVGVGLAGIAGAGAIAHTASAASKLQDQMKPYNELTKYMAKGPTFGKQAEKSLEEKRQDEVDLLTAESDDR